MWGRKYCRVSTFYQKQLEERRRKLAATSGQGQRNEPVVLIIKHPP
jgi:hypothetical protein